ncbi:hypothetical protein ACI49Z_001844 [Cronobacter turicensis]|uniref:COG4648 family protein n=1 Tax=Cronobacter turicensis TaxID=413502 RepID=UPI001DF39D75|nr:hypothetical protein [Cronobacter turicensis]EGT5681764.1 DNA gyrase subunit B [Cronobacter turicensis]EGT5741288.1 DNA gyrase subunit B [Cronobacter turicensis]ELY6320164.1 hypothetical protein [Cronobacter turicensis]MDI6431697.1 hypothetical protein [Cronobacter turicensis]
MTGILTALRRVSAPVTVALTLAWPFVILLGIRLNIMRWMIPVMALLLVARLYQARRLAGPGRFMSAGVAIAGIALCLASLTLRQHTLLLWYPVVVNAVMLMLFGGSLWRGMPLVERLARLRDPELPPRAVSYTRRVTQIWCLFFIFNGAIAAATCLAGDMSLWTLWNGAIAYLLMGLLMAGEWLVRRRIIQRSAV